MAVRWNSEFFTAMEYKDLQANAMAVNSTGTFVLLAGRRFIAIRNLDDLESDSIKKFPRQSKYDVGRAEWNPTLHNNELCVISSNERLEVLKWRGELVQSFSIRAHTRNITDLNWHQVDPNILASCSTDTFIHMWDIRDPRRPALSLSAIAEASQVRWNRVCSYLLATAHDGDIKLWDQRKGTAPIQYIAAHLSKIHGLDWNPNSETQLATSSQDNTVKFFDTSNPKRAEYVITTNAPVWRARFTPFGNGLVTVVIPQLRRGENNLLLWNIANRATPVHTFVGHKDVILEFDWRKQRLGDTDFQLVTWSKDYHLLVWRIEPFLQKLCGHEPEDVREENEAEIVDNIPRKTSRKITSKTNLLQQEFSLLNVQIQNLEVINMDAELRICTVRAWTNNSLLHLQVNFPYAYPHGVPPTFRLLPDSTVEESTVTQVFQTLSHVAQQRVLKNRTCLESCLRTLVATLEQLNTATDNTRSYENSYIESNNFNFSSFNDAYIPFPRSSGAKFCSVSHLVVFGRPAHSRRISGKLEASTPRDFMSLESVYGSKKPNDYMTVSKYYFQKSRNKHSLVNKHSHSVVHIYNTSKLSLINRKLAEEYILDGDVGTICKYNAGAAALEGRWDLVQAWTLAELVSGPQQADEDNTWSSHPFGNRLMQSLITHYASQSDIQTAAMLSCIFGKDQDSTVLKKSNSKSLGSSGSGGSPYHTIPPADVVAEGWVFPLIRTTRSSSLDNLVLEEHVKNIPQKQTSCALYEYYKLAYAETLHRWGLLYKRAEVLKYMCRPSEVHRGVDFLTDCQFCSKPANNCSCSSCRKLALNCIICHISVRGCANCCIVCGHGGHTVHMQEWFSKNDVCPSGCGCHCPVETAGMFTSYNFD